MQRSVSRKECREGHDRESVAGGVWIDAKLAL